MADTHPRSLAPRRWPAGLGAAALCCVLGLACSGGEGGGAGAAGSQGAAGAAGTAGTAGTSGLAGTTGSAGTSGSAGTTGAGATGGSAGATGAAGTTGEGGAGGAAGGTGSAGTSGSGGTGTTGTGGAGGRGGSTGGAGRGGGGGGGAGAGGSTMSAGCGRTPSLKNSPSTTTFNYNTITSGGASRRYILRWPTNYDSSHPYRLILGFHGATGNGGQVAGNPAYFGLFDLSNSSTIFVAPDAVGGIWSAAQDVVFVDDILKQVEADLCIDTTRVELEGFSQGGAMAYTLACARPNVFRAAVVHSGGGLPLPTTCQPIAYFSSLGQQENTQGQTMTSDFFARSDACTIETLPKAPTGGHLCSDYKGCTAGHPVRWCPYDGGHTPSPTDSGQRTSWMPQEVWTFLSQF